MPRADPPGGIKELAKHNATNKSNSSLSRIRKERGKKRAVTGSEPVLTSTGRAAEGAADTGAPGRDKAALQSTEAERWRR